MNQKRALLDVREDTRGATYVPNLLCVKVKSYKSVYQLLAKGNRNRATRHTEMNMHSSRSHAILQVRTTRHGAPSADKPGPRRARLEIRA